jgi:aspartate kinase
MPRTDPGLVVHKFGGAALADAGAVAHAASILARHRSEPALVVVSAMGGVTDALLDLVRAAAAPDAPAGEALVAPLRERHAAAATALPLAAERAAALRLLVEASFDDLAELCDQLRSGERTPSPALCDAVVARGERLAARLLTALLQERGVDAEFVDAACVVFADARHGGASPDFARTARAAAERLAPMLARGAVPVVPGFIGAGPTARS